MRTPPRRTARSLSHVGRLCAASLSALALVFADTRLAVADSVDLDDVTEHHVTDDGYDVRLMLNEMTVNSVANMASTAFSREAFVSSRASVDIEGTGKVPVNAGQVKLGLQVSCQIDLSSGLELNGGASVGATSPSANVGIGAGGINFDTGNLNGNLTGYLDTTIKPGQIVTVPVSVKSLGGRVGATRVLNEHVNVDSCGGPAYLRSFAVVQVSTPTNDDTFSIYGPIVPF